MTNLEVGKPRKEAALARLPQSKKELLYLHLMSELWSGQWQSFNKEVIEGLKKKG